MPFDIEQLRQNTSTDWCLVEFCAVSATSGEKDVYVGDMFVTGGFTKGARQTNQRIRVQCILPAVYLLAIFSRLMPKVVMEILQNIDLQNTKVIMLERHSIEDAATIKQMLRKEFQLAHDESDREVGAEFSSVWLERIASSVNQHS